MNNLQLYKVYRFLIFFLFINSMYPWFTWGMNLFLVSLVAFPICFKTLCNRKMTIRTTNRTIVSLLFLFLFVWLAKYKNATGYVEQLVNWMILTSVIYLRSDLKVDLLRFITKGFAIVLGVSLVFYVITLLGLPLPSQTIVREGLYNVFNNYYALVRMDGSLRFQSIFLEPGHMTMGLSLLLYLNRYDYKNKFVLILLLAQLFSFSLAGYLTLLVGFVLSILLSKGTRKFQRIIIPISVFSLFIATSSTLFKQNMFEELIISRLMWDGTTIAGDNRSNASLDFLYDQVMNSSDKWTGREWTGGEENEHGVSGYKLYLAMYGIVGGSLFFMAYLGSKVLLSRKIKLEWGLLTLIIMLMLQNAYPTWLCVMIPIVCGADFMYSVESEN